MRTTTRKAYANKSVLPPNLLISIRNESESELAFKVLNSATQSQHLATAPSASALTASPLTVSPWLYSANHTSANHTSAGPDASTSASSSGALATLALPTGPLPTGPLPTGPLPTGPLPTGPLPTGPLPTGPLPWIDLKEPNRGALGRPDLETAHRVYARFQTFERNSSATSTHNFSIALGELSETSDDEITDYCSFFRDDVYFKIGLANLDQCLNWPKRLIELVRSLKLPSRLILVHYADAEKANSPTWDEILEVSRQIGCEYILVDTWLKDGRSLLDILSRDSLKHMAAHAQAMGMQIAMAGSLRVADLETLLEISPQWIGFRSDLCESRNRESSLSPSRLRSAIEMFRSIHTEPTEQPSVNSEARVLEQNVIR